MRGEHKGSLCLVLAPQRTAGNHEGDSPLHPPWGKLQLLPLFPSSSCPSGGAEGVCRVLLESPGTDPTSVQAPGHHQTEELRADVPLLLNCNKEISGKSSGAQSHSISSSRGHRSFLMGLATGFSASLPSSSRRLNSSWTSLVENKRPGLDKSKPSLS